MPNMKDVMAGVVLACLMMGGLLILALKLLAAWQRFVESLRTGPAPQPVHGSVRPAVNVINYRTRNGRTDYKFRIQRMGASGYRIYIVEQPDYGERSTDSHPTHRLSDQNGYYVCWSGNIESVEAARRVAALWADKTEDYILHGRRF